MLRQRAFIAIAALVGVLITAMLVTAAIWPVVREVETGRTPEYPEIQPLYYSAEPQRVYDEAVAAAGATPRFVRISDDRVSRTIRAEATSPALSFTFDVELRVEPVTEFVTRVMIKSSSRVGKGDLGQNARNIRAVSAELERRLGAVRFVPEAVIPNDSAAPPAAAPAAPAPTDPAE